MCVCDVAFIMADMTLEILQHSIRVPCKHTHTGIAGTVLLSFPGAAVRISEFGDLFDLSWIVLTRRNS